MATNNPEKKKRLQVGILETPPPPTPTPTSTPTSITRTPPAFIPVVKPIYTPLKKTDFTIEEMYNGIYNYFQDISYDTKYEDLTGRQKYYIKQKLLFLAFQDILTSIMTDLATHNYNQKQFFTMFSGSYFLRLISNFSLQTSDIDMKLYPFDTSISLHPEVVLQKIKQDIIYVQNTLNNPQSPYNISYHIMLYRKSILEHLVNYENEKTSNTFLSTTILQVFEELEKNTFLFDISPKPEDNYLLKIIIYETDNITKRNIIYALGDITIFNKETENSEQKQELRKQIKEMIEEDKDNVENYAFNKETTTYINKPFSLGIMDIGNYIPEFILLMTEQGKQIVIPSYRYYYYEKKALYCDMIEDTKLCVNYDNDGRKNVFNNAENTYLIDKFRKQLQTLKSSFTPQYMGGKTTKKKSKTSKTLKKKSKTSKTLKKKSKTSKTLKKKSKTSKKKISKSNLYKSCCKVTDTYNGECIRKQDGKIFTTPRKYTRKQCKKAKGFSMKSSCAPYKYCK
jgi:hypothetical protein